MAEPLRFFADAMLGRLVKRLRLRGWDTRYQAAIDDGELVRLAAADGRIILTRDRRLMLRRGARGAAFLLRENRVDDQWRELTARWPELLAGEAFSRCAECNARIQDADAEAVRERVPPYVYRTQERFYACPGCGRVYWPGTHVPRILRLIGQTGRDNS